MTFCAISPNPPYQSLPFNLSVFSHFPSRLFRDEFMIITTSEIICPAILTHFFSLANDYVNFALTKAVKETVFISGL